MKSVLFVCVENANRSQMAEAFARRLGEGILEPYSAGSRPSGEVNPRAIHHMNEIEYDLSGHRSKSLDEVPDGPYDYVITMGCGDECPFIPAKNRDDWDLTDPKTLDDEGFRAVRDEIQRRVSELIDQL
ncbi:MAG: arsenate reductase ArsC [Bacteroidota bacterium]